MANGFAGGGTSLGQAARGAPRPPPSGRPPTGGLDPGPSPGPTGPTAQPGGFAFGSPQASGFEGLGGGQSNFGFGIDPGGGRDLQGSSGGFQSVPRTLAKFEIADLNNQFGTTGTPDAFSTNAFRTRQLLGPFGFIADPSTFHRGQIPAIEANLNFQNLLQAQNDRQGALDLLSQQRDVIGQDPEQQAALAVALRRLQNPDPFTPEEVSQQQSAIRQRGAQGIEAAQRQQAESLARQGVAGGATAFQEAQQRQAGGRQVSDELQRLAIQNALGRDTNEAQAVDRLEGITGQNELRQIALNQAISELLTAQRGEFDLSGLAGKERKAERGVLSKIGFF